jgi:hypothetical protein
LKRSLNKQFFCKTTGLSFLRQPHCFAVNEMQLFLNYHNTANVIILRHQLLFFDQLLQIMNQQGVVRNDPVFTDADISGIIA